MWLQHFVQQTLEPIMSLPLREHQLPPASDRSYHQYSAPMLPIADDDDDDDDDGCGSGSHHRILSPIRRTTTVIMVEVKNKTTIMCGTAVALDQSSWLLM